MQKLTSKLSFLIVGVALILFPAVSFAADTSGKGPMDFDFKTAGWTVGIFLTALLASALKRAQLPRRCTHSTQEIAGCSRLESCTTNWHARTIC